MLTAVNRIAAHKPGAAASMPDKQNETLASSVHVASVTGSTVSIIETE
jgi:hypothetical protein